MSKLPDLEGLAMFAKVVEARSYAGAARSLGVSVATVSRAVSRLEDRLGGRLFNRSSRRLALTEFGRGLAERAAHIYAEAEDMKILRMSRLKRRGTRAASSGSRCRCCSERTGWPLSCPTSSVATPTSPSICI